VFSAMMMDDSSSDDEEEFAEKAAPISPVRAVAAKTSNNKVEKDNSSHPGSANFIKVKGSQAASKSNTTSSSSNNNNNNNNQLDQLIAFHKRFSPTLYPIKNKAARLSSL